MTIKDLVNRAFGKKQMSIIQSFGLGGTVGFPGSKEEYVQMGYEGNSAVYAAVKLMSEIFASSPHKLYKVKNQKALAEYKTLSSSYAPSSLKRYKLKEAAFDEIDQHPLLSLLDRPNIIEGGFDFREHANAMRDITGDCFIWVNRGLTGGDPLQLKILPSQYMMLKVSSPFDVEGYVLQLGKPTSFTTDEVIHWKYPNLNFDAYGLHLFGQSPLKAASNDFTLTAHKEGKKASAKTFKNQGAGGLISRNDDTAWKKEQRDELITYFDEYINGADNRGKVRPVNSKLQYIQLVQSATEMQIVQALQMTKEDICNIYNIPSHIFSGGRATMNNVGESNKYLVTKTVYPKWISWRDMINGKLLPMYKDSKGLYYDFDITSFPEVQDDQAKFIESLQNLPLTPNEIRGATGWDTIENDSMNKVYMKSTQVPIDKLNEPFGADLSGDMGKLEGESVKDYDY